jgi:hypothetical protein
MPCTVRPRASWSRRDFLGAGASWTGLGLGALFCGSPRGEAMQAGSDTQGTDAAADVLDAALERIDARTPDTNLHRSNHAPMVAEALCVLGRADAIEGWLDYELAAFEPYRGPLAAIDAEDWRAALGKSARFADWRAHFRAELQEHEWTTVVARWGPRLVPGLAGVATHGVIRTAHAARALAARDNPVRRGELANGLAYWAATYEELPWDGSIAPQPSVEAALAKVVPRQPALAPPSGNIMTGLRSLTGTPAFLPVAGLVETSDPARTLSEMAAAFARLYLANSDRIAFTHSITAPSALRLLAPYLTEECVRSATRYAWQAAAGLYVVYGDPRRTAPEPASAATEPETLVALAIETGGAHAIKLAEACLREDALSHDPILLQAALDGAATMTH